MKVLKYFTLLIAVVLLASCDDFLDVNDDPNNPTSVAPSLILPVAQNYTARMIQDDRRVNCLGNLMMYNWSQSDGFSWYSDEFKYLVTSSFYRNIFSESYTNALKQYHQLEGLGAEYDNYKAIAKIMKAYHFQLLVDLYGDVPYTEALLRKENATPKYDDAKTIYEDLIVQLSAAIELIDNAEATKGPSSDDIVFGGDMTEWKKFANTIKMRILVRQSSMSGRDAYIKEQISAIVAEGSGFITGDVGVNPGYLQEENKQNPIWQAYGKEVSGSWTMNNQATCASDYIITYLTDTKDPRIDFIYEKPASGHLGVPQGLLDYDTPVQDAYVPDNVSNLGTGILKNYNQDAIIFTLAESNFNQAEAAFKGLMTGDAKTLYENGVKASFDYLGATGYTGYIAQIKNLVKWESSSNKLQAIITQKWIAVNSITAEQSWFDYSRTGYPAGLPISLQASKSDRPVRLYYTSEEISSNGANVPAQPDAFTGKIFWAK